LQIHQIEQPAMSAQPHGMSEMLPQAATVEQAPTEKNGEQPVLPPELAEVFYVGNELRNLVDFTQGEQGVEVRFWKRNPAQIIGFTAYPAPGED
jgi:hypothetical protein